MRYSEVDLQCTDVIWFGVDRSDNILVFTSAGCGCIPEYVCRSQEETNTLEEYFSSLPQSKVAQAEDGINEDVKCEAISWAQRGIYYFDVAFDDGYADSYVKVACPKSPMRMHDLPNNIKKILADHMIDADASSTNRIKVKHAY